MTIYNKPISLLLAMAISLSATLSKGQQSAADRTEPVVTLDAFSVSGTRASLIKALEFKREAVIVSDSIVAEDVAKFPDLNLAESLQRLPGVAINREAGEGRRVSLRGLGPDFTRVQLNGMEVLGNVDSPQDSRGQGTRDRAFDFNIFASELFNRMDIYKSFEASQNEGGLAGTVGLVTAKPFDYTGVQTAISAQAGTNTATGDLQPRFAAQASNNWGTFGALFSVAYSSRDTEEQGYNTYRWRLRDSRGSDISGLPQADQDAINSGELRFARGNRLSVWQSNQERLGLTSALQWKPSDNFSLTLDVLHGQFDGERDELHLAARGSSSTWLGGGTTVDGVTYPNSTINEIRYNEGNEVVYLDVSGANIATETRRQTTENTFDQVVLSADWDLNDRLSLQALLGTEESEYKIPTSDKFYLETFGDVISDYTIDRFYGYNTYGFDSTDPSVWRAHEIDFSASEQTSTFDNAKLDFDFLIAPGSSLKFGAAYQTFSNEGFTRANNNVLRSEWQSGAVDDDVTPYVRTFSDHDDQSWAIVDFDAALAGFGVTRDPGPQSRIFEVEEDTTALYTQYEWSTLVGGMTFRGNAGLRYYETEITSSGEANVGLVSVSEKYDDILPALNTALNLTDDLILRTSLFQNINRPGLGAMAINGNLSENQGEITVSVGNPSLDPYESDNLDISLEWYFSDAGYFAVGYYYKDITGFIGTEIATNVPYSATGLPLDLLPGLTPDTIVSEYSRPVNYEQTELNGIEFTLQTDLTFLPSPFDRLGFVGNLSFIDADLDYATPAEQAAGVTRIMPLEGLSDTLGNATLYYETDRWGVRVSANYRSDYISSAVPIGTDQDSAGFNSTTYVDFSAFYQINEKLKLTFDAINLTDQREEQFSDSARRLYNSTTSGTSFFAGVNYKF